ncbi:MAG: biopolymer transporter ExbD [Steroidobacteraceae bacterium]
MALKFNRNPEELEASYEINVTPFIDVMLVLLVIFMLTAPLSAVRIPVNLPQSSSKPQTASQPPVVLSVQQDLSLALGNTPVARDELPGALARLTHGDMGMRIYVRADQSIRYGDLMAVMDLLSRAGYQKVALVGRGGGAPSQSPPGASPSGAR